MRTLPSALPTALRSEPVTAPPRSGCSSSGASVGTVTVVTPRKTSLEESCRCTVRGPAGRPATSKVPSGLTPEAGCLTPSAPSSQTDRLALLVVTPAGSVTWPCRMPVGLVGGGAGRARSTPVRVVAAPSTTKDESAQPTTLPNQIVAPDAPDAPAALTAYVPAARCLTE